MQHQFVERVAFIFQRGGNGEPLAVLEKTEDHAALGGRAISVDQPKRPPRMSRRS